jgi:hypothetical protein
VTDDSRPRKPDVLFSEEELRLQIRRYLDRFAWDIAENETRWRRYQRRNMRRDYSGDKW